MALISEPQQENTAADHAVSPKIDGFWGPGDGPFRPTVLASLEGRGDNSIISRARDHRARVCVPVGVLYCIQDWTVLRSSININQTRVCMYCIT
jgi:hypothetical protein